MYYFSYVVVAIGLIHKVATACWINLSAGDLLEKSNTIIVGEVQEAKSNMDFPLDYFKSNSWQVKIKFCLKGEKTAEQISGLTPVKNVSTHYDLNQRGTQVILFMVKRGEDYEPLSPQAVVPIKYNEEIINPSKINSGKEAYVLP